MKKILIKSCKECPYQQVWMNRECQKIITDVNAISPNCPLADDLPESKLNAKELWNRITSNGMREMTEERFYQALKEFDLSESKETGRKCAFLNSQECSVVGKDGFCFVPNCKDLLVNPESKDGWIPVKIKPDNRRRVDVTNGKLVSVAWWSKEENQWIFWCAPFFGIIRFWKERPAIPQERGDGKMRYFNIEQHREPEGMFSGDKKVDISELEKTAKEITEEQSRQKPTWGSGNISVDENGNWKWMATCHDTSD